MMTIINVIYVTHVSIFNCNKINLSNDKSYITNFNSVEITTTFYYHTY